jgi:hypothetical protein
MRMAETIVTGLALLGVGLLKFGVPDEARQLVSGSAQPEGLKSTDDPWSKDYVDRSLVTYQNCDAARRAGAAPIYQWQDGYSEKLDADRDGIACEPYRGR